MPSWCNKANAYTLGWCVYYLQGTLYPVGSLLSQLVLAILLLTSLYYYFIANTRYKLPIYFSGLNLLIVLFSIYGLHLIITYDASEYALKLPSYTFLKNIWISLLPIYSFFVFFKDKRIAESTLLVWIFVFFLVATANYYENHQAQLIAAMIRHSAAEEFTNNVGYEFLALVPACVFLYKKNVIQYFALGYCVFFMLMAMKRGAIIIGFFCLIWFLWNNIKNANYKMKVGVVALSMLLCFSGYKFIQMQMKDSLFFQKRVEDTIDGNSSERDKIYYLYANYFWNNTSPFHFALGSGADATLKIYDYAHNDWLEIAVNQGVIGLIVYIVYWLLFFRMILSKNFTPRVKLTLQLLFVIYFMKTFFSMSYSDMAISATFVLGYCLAQENKNEQVVYSY